jgi:hypothetical protein
VSQTVDLAIVVKGMAELIAAIVEGGLEHEEAKEFRAEDGRVHAVDLVVRDGKGAAVGVKVDGQSGTATFVGHDAEGRARALAHRVAQRYAYAKVTQELKRKGYQIAREEKQPDGTIKLVAQRWR